MRHLTTEVLHRRSIVPYPGIVVTKVILLVIVGILALNVALLAGAALVSLRGRRGVGR